MKWLLLIVAELYSIRSIMRSIIRSVIWSIIWSVIRSVIRSVIWSVIWIIIRSVIRNVLRSVIWSVIWSVMEKSIMWIWSNQSWYITIFHYRDTGPSRFFHSYPQWQPATPAFRVRHRTSDRSTPCTCATKSSPFFVLSTRSTSSPWRTEQLTLPAVRWRWSCDQLWPGSSPHAAAGSPEAHKTPDRMADWAVDWPATEVPPWWTFWSSVCPCSCCQSFGSTFCGMSFCTADTPDPSPWATKRRSTLHRPSGGWKCSPTPVDGRFYGECFVRLSVSDSMSSRKKKNTPKNPVNTRTFSKKKFQILKNRKKSPPFRVFTKEESTPKNPVKTKKSKKIEKNRKKSPPFRVFTEEENTPKNSVNTRTFSKKFF